MNVFKRDLNKYDNKKKFSPGKKFLFIKVWRKRKNLWRESAEYALSAREDIYFRKDDLSNL
jgi:hypothetical protein